MIGGAGTTIALLLGALILAVLAVLVDRLNFPQRPFRPRPVTLHDGRTPPRDRTGAHIVDDPDDDDDGDGTGRDPAEPDGSVASREPTPGA